MNRRGLVVVLVLLLQQIGFSQVRHSAVFAKAEPHARSSANDWDLERMSKRQLATSLRIASDERHRERAMRYAQMVTHSLEQTNLDRNSEAAEDLQEVLAAMHNANQPPIQPPYDFFAVPFAFASRLRNRIGSEAVPESLPAKSKAGESSVGDPADSSFWHRPESIERQDLYHGFGRVGNAREESKLWEYAGPKLSY